MTDRQLQGHSLFVATDRVLLLIGQFPVSFSIPTSSRTWILRAPIPCPRYRNDHQIPDRRPRNLQSLQPALETRTTVPVADPAKRSRRWHEDRVNHAATH